MDLFEAYMNAKATVAAFERMFMLEEENAQLKAKLKEHDDRVSRMFIASQEQIGKTLSALSKL